MSQFQNYQAPSKMNNSYIGMFVRNAYQNIFVKLTRVIDE